MVQRSGSISPGDPLLEPRRLVEDLDGRVTESASSDVASAACTVDGLGAPEAGVDVEQRSRPAGSGPAGRYRVQRRRRASRRTTASGWSGRRWHGRSECPLGAVPPGHLAPGRRPAHRPRLARLGPLRVHDRPATRGWSGRRLTRPSTRSDTAPPIGRGAVDAGDATGPCPPISARCRDAHGRDRLATPGRRRHTLGLPAAANGTTRSCWRPGRPRSRALT